MADLDFPAEAVWLRLAEDLPPEALDAGDSVLLAPRDPRSPDLAVGLVVRVSRHGRRALVDPVRRRLRAADWYVARLVDESADSL